MIYFGCIGGPGHYFWKPGPRTDWRAGEATPWGEFVDSVLCPGTSVYVDSRGQQHLRTPDHQPEGVAAIHHKDGWTALAFWDRSVDKRGGCNSAFFVEGTLAFDEMVDAAKSAFPSVWSRFKFSVVEDGVVLAAGEKRAAELRAAIGE